MLEPNSLRSHEFDSEDWVNGNWHAPKSDTLLVSSISDNFQTISTPTAEFYFQRFDDLSVRDSEVTPEDEAGTVYLDLRTEPRDLELEARRWRQVSRCQNIFRRVPNIFALVAAVSRPPAGPLRGLRPSLRRLCRGLHTRPLLMSRYSEYIFKDSRVAGGLWAVEPLL